jgi:small GTP-binding protein
MSEEFIFKIVLIGDKMVGKTSLINRFVHGGFQGRYMGTIGLNVSTKDMIITSDDNETYNIHLLIYDLASEESFEDLFGPFAKGANGAIFVCDTTRKNTLHSIDDWVSRLDSLTRIINNSILVGNKSDLSDFREINLQDGKDKSKAYNMIDYAETSAKDDLFVEEAFLKITKSILQNNLKT